MSKVKVNYKSDLPPIEVTFKLGEDTIAVPSHDFAVRFFIEGAPGKDFICSYIGGVYKHCEKTDSTTLTCYIDNHGFNCGRLCCEFVSLDNRAATGGKYADGVQKTVTPSSLDILLVEGAGDSTSSVSANASVDLTELIGDVRQLQMYELGSKTYDSDDLDYGYMYTTNVAVGETISGTRHTGSNIAALKLQLSRGDTVSVRTKGGYGGRAYCLTDNNLVVKVVAAQTEDTTSSPVTLMAEKDGYAFIHCMTNDEDALAAFSVVHRYSDERRLIAENAADIASVAAEIGDLNQYAIGKTHLTSSSLTEYRYYYLNYSAGAIAPDTPTEYPGSDYTNWACARLSVTAGEIINLSTLGGGNARAWALTDKNRKILEVAPADTDTTTTPVVINVEKDGYLYVNCKNTGWSKFYLDKLLNVPASIAALWEQGGGEAQPVDAEIVSEKYQNTALPLYKDTLKVLAIGNSFTIDPMRYIKDIVNASGITTSKLSIYSVTTASKDLKYWADNIDTTLGSDKVVNRAGAVVELPSTLTLRNVISLGWDVVVVHQLSTGSSNYVGINPDLTRLVGYIRESCPNQQVAIAYQMTWSDKSNYNGGAPKGLNGWKDICKAVQEIVVRNGIDIVIPTGTAIQNARATDTFGSHAGEMTRDGHHLAYGIGCYIASCTWFQTLIAPMFGASILGNAAVHAITTAEESDTSASNSVAVTNGDSGNKSLCQQCAFAATIDMYNVTEVDESLIIPDHTITPASTIYDRVEALEQGGGGGGEQVQADWSQNDSTAVDFIKNKPSLATVATSGSYNDLNNKPTIPAAQVNADWNASSGVAQILNKPTIPTIPATATQSEVDAGSSTSQRTFTPKLIHDNAYIVEETYSSGSLKANKIYDFGTVSSALTIPSLDATNDLVSNALNFYALRFIAGADNISITFPTGVEVDDTPTINTGDYVEIMINLYVENSTNHFYASIKVWQTQ